jgi:hypothetical protein
VDLIALRDRGGELSRLHGCLLHHWVSRYKRMRVENPGPLNIRHAEDEKDLIIKKTVQRIIWKVKSINFKIVF